MDFNIHIADLIKIKNIDNSGLKTLIVPGIKEGQGDYCLPCFKLAKALNLNPNETAKAVLENLKESDYILKTEIIGGYLNFYLNYSLIANDIIRKILDSGDDYGKSKEGNGKTICIDFSSINIAKPFHIGHLSTTVIGGALYRIYRFLGYNVIGVNHLGDHGTQFGKLILAYKKWSSKSLVEEGKIKELLRIYVKYHQEAEKDPGLDIQARAFFKKIEENDPECMEIFQFFKNITLDDVKKVYELLDITFDSYDGESFYSDKMQGIIDELRDKNLLKLSDSAYI